MRSGHLKEKMRRRRRRIHGSTEGGWQLSSLTALDDTRTVWMDEGWAADVIYCHFSRALGTFFSCVLVYKLSYHSLDEAIGMVGTGAFVL